MSVDSPALLVGVLEAEELKARVPELPSADLGKRQLCNLELLVNGAFAPLSGFLGRADHESVLETMHLADGTLWPMPMSLDLPERIGVTLEPGSSLAINDREGFLIGVLEVEDVWKADKVREAEAVFGTADAAAHPGVRLLFEETGPYYVGGRLRALAMPRHYDALDLRMTPGQVRARFAAAGWERVLGVHAVKPLHRADLASLLEAAGRTETKLFLQPSANQPALVDDDHFMRVRCYRAFMRHLPEGMGLLGLLPLAARHAGPREALLQAMVHGNYGCTHFLVQPDQADPCSRNGDERFYPRGAALELVERHAGETEVTPVEAVPMAYHVGSQEFVPESEAMGEADSLPEREFIHRLDMDLPVPEWFTFPEVMEVFRSSHPARHQQGFTVFLTGLSGAGKSTLAKILYVKFMQAGDRPVTLLDGDIVRKNLSNELDFSREHRNVNIRRIGFVAAQITKNRGIALCAPIAPYEGSRKHNRELISRYGAYVEVYLSTPLEVCENRDVKGLYAKARAGIKRGVTGIDDPYETPVDPDLIIDTSNASPTEAAQRIMVYLRERGYVR